MDITTPDRKNQLITTFTYYAAFLGLGATMSISGPSLTWLAANTNSLLAQISFIFIFNSAGYILGSQLGGRLYDRVPGHRIQSLAMVFIAICLGLIPLLHSIWLLLAVLFVFGLVTGSLDVGCNTLITWIHGSKVGPFMNGLHFFVGVGSFLAPLIFARVVSALDQINWAYWSIALFMLPVAAWLWFLPSPPIRKKGIEEHATKNLAWLPALFVLFYIFTVGVEFGYGNWIYTYALRLELADKSVAALLTSAFWGAFTIGRLVAIWISSRLKPLVILALDLAGCVAGLIILLAFPSSSAILWIGTIVMGFSIASVFPTGMAYAEQRMHLSGSLVGWILVGAGLGGMIFSWLIGQLFERVGPGITMPVVLVCDLVSILLLLGMSLSVRKKEPA